MNTTYKRELFSPQEIKEMYPVSNEGTENKKRMTRKSPTPSAVNQTSSCLS